MSWGSILGFIGLAVAAVGAVGSFFAGKDRADALNNLASSRRSAQALEERKNSVRQRRERMKVIREGRIKRAAAVSNAQAQGALTVGGSARGGFGSLISQTSANLGYLAQLGSIVDEQNIFFRQAAMFGDEARRAGEKQSLFRGIGSFGSSIFKSRADIADIFS